MLIRRGNELKSQRLVPMRALRRSSGLVVIFVRPLYGRDIRSDGYGWRCYDPGMSSRTGWLMLLAIVLMVLPYVVVWIGQTSGVRF